MSELAIHGGLKAAADLQEPIWPTLTASDRQAVIDVLDSQEWGRLHPNSQAEAFEQAFAAYQDAAYGVAVSNGTVALELALVAAGIRPGDEVLVPAVTFIASAGAIACQGAIPVFVDSDPETITMSPAAAAQAITPRTKGIVVVHYGGYPADMDAFVALAREHDLVLIEDCAHAQGTAWRGRKAGSFGHFGCFSFQQSKALASGEGGIVITNDEHLAKEAKLYHNIGRKVGFPGYEHFVLASNYRLPELSAALLLAQFSRLDEQVQNRMDNAAILAEELDRIGGIKLLKRDERITQRGYYFLVLRYDTSQFANVPLRRFIAALNAEGVRCGSGYGIPLYKQRCFERAYVAEMLGRAVADTPDYPNLYLPVAEHFCAEEQITLPHPILLSGPDGMRAIAAAVAKIKAHAEELLETT